MAKKLTQAQKEQILNDTLYGKPIDETLKAIGFTRREFKQYLKENQAFKDELHEEEQASCFFLENDLLNVCHIVKDEHVKSGEARPEWQMSGGQHKIAAVRLNAIAKRLSFLKPEKYGNKLDLNLNQTVSIKTALDNANTRIASIIRDVTPIQIAAKTLTAKKAVK